MSDLKTLWQEAKERHSPDEIISSAVVHEAIRRRSGGIMDKLLKAVKYKFWYSVASFIILLVFMVISENLAVQILIAIIEIAMLAGIYFFYREYRELSREIDITAVPLDVMKRFEARIRKIIRYEEWVGLTMYPLSASAGFIIGVNVDPNNDPFFDELHEWLIYLAVIAILTPLCHWFARWMNRVAFGKLLKKLNENISELESAS